jgi:protein-tyrosine phosphatase
MTGKVMVKVLFVCLGNICRSPSAEGVFRKLLISRGLEQQVHIDSAGTHAYHVGEPPDARAQQAAARRGVDLADLRGRQVTVEDFTTYDYVLAMDRENLHNLERICPMDASHKLRLFMDFAHNWSNEEVPDPYFGGKRGFEQVLDMIEDAAEGLLAELLSRQS